MRFSVILHMTASLAAWGLIGVSIVEKDYMQCGLAISTACYAAVIAYAYYMEVDSE